jgi:hypothetical protein
MTKKVGKKPAPKPDIPTDEPGQQPTPDADALTESEVADSSAGAGTTIAAIGAALRAAGVSASRQQLDRAFTRDAFDTDIGYHEGLRHLQLKDFSSMTNLSNVLNFISGVKAMNKESFANTQDTNTAFYEGLKKATSTAAAGLLDAHGLETDNEVLTTVALTKLVQGLANEIAGIKQAIFDATPKAG